MDGVLVDFGKQVKKARENPNLSDRLKNHPDQIPNIFKNPPVYEGAIEGVNQLYSSNCMIFLLLHHQLGLIQ